MIAGLLATAAVAAALPLSGATIHVDAGHNGANGRHPDTINRQVPAGRGYRKACDTTGTQTDDGRLTEARLNLDVALRLERRLRRLGARVAMTRRDNRGVGPCVNERAAIGNRARADTAVSLHADGGPRGGHGFHVIAPAAGPRLVAPGIAAPSLRLARRLRTALRGIGLAPATYIARDGLDVRNDLGGLNLSRVPKAFVEMGNMRNAADARRLRTPAHRERVAGALASAIRAHLGR